MDERLQKALEFSNYTLTLNNQKRNIKNRVAQLQLVHHNGGTFIADHQTIAFLKAMVDMDNTKNITVLDSKDNPVKLVNVQEVLTKLVEAYNSAMNEYQTENEKLRKARSIKQIMDW